LIEVYYHAPSQIVQVWTYEFSTGWVQHGADIPVAFANSDTFGARATADGSVEVYKNGTLLGTRDITSWTYYASGGYIGLWLIHAPNARLDDFGGGNVGSVAYAPALAQDSGVFHFASYRSSNSDSSVVNPVLSSVEGLPPLLPLALPLQQTTSLTIDYTYDALHRLTGATYNDGRSFGYTYDAAGNVLELQQNLGPGTVTTTYNYNTANELVTAAVDGTTWNYAYDANGSLTEVLPNGNPGNGAKRYTYNAAGNLVQVEAHNGSNWDIQAEMNYNGLGQRLSMDAAGVIAYYVMDGGQQLTAESAGNTTFFLYGRGAIGEKTTGWNFSLPDGTNTPRQLTNALGEITLSSRYTPWGDSLELHGTGNFSFGYLGGVLDATTGLLYVGNGQYYDLSTGRFLTRDVNPNSTNPYVPWNPIGAILGPIGLIALVFGRKKKGSKTGTFLVLLLVTVSVGMTISACKVTVEVTPTQVPYPAQIVTVTTDTGYTATFVVATPTSPSTPLAIPCLTPLENVSVPTQTPTPTLPAKSNPRNLNTSEKEKNVIKYWESGQLPPDQQPKPDIADRCTIGYGHTFWNPHHPEGKGCSREVLEWYAAHPLPVTGPDGTESAEGFLQSDIEKSELVIERNIVADLTQAQFDALVSYIFNVGEGKLIEKKIPELINNGNYQEAATAIGSGPITSGGIELDILKERRQAEAVLFLTGDYGNYIPWSP
jgi:RHS repeat-associated protein